MPPRFDPEYEPRLYDAGGDITKRWYIDFRIWDTDKQIFVRKQYTGMNKYKTLAARRKVCKAKLMEIKKLIEAGFTSGKRKTALRLYDIRSITLKEAYNFFCNVKNGLKSSKFTLEPTYSAETASISRGTFKNFKITRKSLFEWLDAQELGGIRLMEVNSDTANAFLDYLKEEKGIANKTFNDYLAHMRSVYTFFSKREDETTIVNPFLKVEKRKVKKSLRHVPYTNVQLATLREKMLQKGEKQLFLFVNFIYYTFARPGEELRRLRVGDIREQTIFIPVERAKSEGGHIKIPPGLERMIQENGLRNYPPNYYVFSVGGSPGERPVGINHFYKKHSKILKELGFTDKEYTIYGYKHTGAINLYLATKDVKLVQHHCRHSNSAQTDEYLRDLGVIRNDGIDTNFPDF